MKDKKGRQIGCGYCALEKTCSIHDPKINRALLGCESYLHFKDAKTLEK
jgi:hypothetical protein